MSYLPIKGYEDLYEVSSKGEVRSLDREILGKDGKLYPFKGMVLRANSHKNLEYLQVSLWKGGKGTSFYVHRLVAEAHIPNPNNLAEVNHINGNRLHNWVDNLEWVSRKGNAQHAIESGLKIYTNRLTYDDFYECLLSVINGESYSSLSNRVPYKVPFLSTKIRQIAKELGLENDLDTSLAIQKANRARINGAKNF